MTNKSKTWVVVANSCNAEIYALNSAKDITKIQDINFPEGREKSGSILTDRPGRSFARVGNKRHALGTQVDPHTHELKVFAHQLSEIIQKAAAENAFERLVLIAPPQFLGELRQVLSDPVKKKIFKEFGKDYFSDNSSEQDRIDQICKCLEIKRPAAPRLYQ